MTENGLKLLALIRTSGGISRADLAKQTGLSRPAVSALIEQLLSTGLIAETGHAESRGGKPPIRLAIVPEACSAIGIDMGEENIIRGVVCDGAGHVMVEREVPGENVFAAMVNVTAELVKQLRQTARNVTLCGIGIAVSGIVDGRRNEVLTSSNFDLSGKPLASELVQRCQLPVILGNRARTAAHAEKIVGNAREFSDFLYLSIGKSIGCSIYQNHRLWMGSNNGAGEISTLLVPTPDGLDKLENVIRESYLCSAYRQITGQRITWTGLASAWLQGDSNALKVINDNLAAMVYATAVAVNLLNPQAVILGGRFKELGEPYRAAFQQQLQGLLVDILRNSVVVKMSAHGRAASALGAALQVIDRVFRFEL